MKEGTEGGKDIKDNLSLFSHIKHNINDSTDKKQ